MVTSVWPLVTASLQGHHVHVGLLHNLTSWNQANGCKFCWFLTALRWSSRAEGTCCLMIGVLPGKAVAPQFLASG